ncbi:MAG: hypothetical protein QXH30_00830 [Candidatus Bilamarchaeaceae archaeon]
MAAIEVGRVCVKKFGRDSGKEVVISRIIDGNFVMVRDSKGKESKASIGHLEPTSRKA